MRLFTGISLAPNVVNRLASVLSEVKPAARLNWSPVENLHITLRFIGTWPEDRLPELKAELAAVAVTGPIPIRVQRFGFFPNPQHSSSHHPHSFFAGVQAPPALAALVTAMGSSEDRDYRPHVTLARIKGTPDLNALRERIAAMTDYDFGGFEAREFHLYSSQPGARCSTYAKLATYDLMREKSEIR